MHETDRFWYENRKKKIYRGYTGTCARTLTNPGTKPDIEIRW